ncbi:MAG: 30S ribosome-binding factor RbfA [Phycisphaerales bacterium]|jgi:ribosome-binding factor A|nr:30S ribosome-binding factor RbfA [Phycisphaerales bacterium]
MTQRTEQVAATLKRAIQDVIVRGLSDPRIKGLITVTRIDVSPDLADATVFCTITPSEHEELSLHGLSSASRWVRRKAADHIRIRRMPKLHFKLDKKLRREQDVMASIEQARIEDEKRAKKYNTEG